MLKGKTTRKIAVLGVLLMTLMGGGIAFAIRQITSLKEEINYTSNGVIPGLMSDSNLKGKILVWHTETARSVSSIRQTITAYQKLHPNIKIIVGSLPSNQLTVEIIENTRGGLAPNLMLVNYTALLDLVEAEAVIPIEPLPQFKNYLPTALSQVTYQGKIYGLPGAILTQVLCYNKTKIKNTKPFKTLDEMLYQANLGYSVGIPSSFMDTVWGLKYYSPTVFNQEGDLSITPGSWAQWLTWLLKAKGQPNILLEADLPALNQAFEENRLTYLICDASRIDDFQKKLGKDNLGVTILPYHQGIAAGPFLYTKVLALGNSSSIRQRQIALDFAQFATNPEQVRQRIVFLEGFIPPDGSLKINPALFPIEATLMNQSKTAIAIPLDKLPIVLRISQRAEELYQQVIADSLTPDKAGIILNSLITRQPGYRQNK